MFDFLKKLFNFEYVKVPSSDKYDGSHWDLSKGCPDCGYDKIYEGPQGGMCTNICCANPLCRSAFNVMGIANMVQRIPNTHFRSAFPECPEESEHYLRTQGLGKESEEIFESLDCRTYG
jgi:hypothetical protein